MKELRPRGGGIRILFAFDYLSTLSDYIEALGGRLEITAVFEDGSVSLIPRRN